MQMAKAGLKAIYLSGWQVAGDNNLAAQTYPDQSLYPANSAPKLVERINNAFIRADQIAHMEGSERHIDYFLPIVADCEAGFGGPLNAFELTKSMVMMISSLLKYSSHPENMHQTILPIINYGCFRQNTSGPGFVQMLDSAIHWINNYPADKHWENQLYYSTKWRFVQLIMLVHILNNWAGVMRSSW